MAISKGPALIKGIRIKNFLEEFALTITFDLECYYKITERHLLHKNSMGVVSKALVWEIVHALITYNHLFHI